MSEFRDKAFDERLSTAENARKAMPERVRVNPGAARPDFSSRTLRSTAMNLHASRA